jgi:hypothetical protein
MDRMSQFIAGLCGALVFLPGLIVLLLAPIPVGAQQSATAKGAGTRTTGNTGARLALVIGNASYARKPLANPVNDAEAVARALRSSGFEVITGFNLTKPDLEERLLRFGEKLKTTKGVGLFYYSGHGMQIDGENYLLPVEFDIDKVPDRRLARNFATNLGVVLGYMEVAGNQFNLVVLDACRDNPFEKGWKSTGSQGLATTQSPSGTLIAYATAPNQTAADGNDSLSPYTSALVRQIGIGGQNIYSVFSNVGEEVENKTGGRQQPWIASSLRGGPFCFHGCGLTENSISSPPPGVQSVAPSSAPPSVVRGRSGIAKVDYDQKSEGAFVIVKIGENESEFSTYWTDYGLSTTCLYIYGITSLATVPASISVRNSTEAAAIQPTKYRCAPLAAGSRAVVKNHHGKFALIRILTITHSDDDHMVIFEYEILPD